MNNGWTLEKIRYGGKKGLEGRTEFIRGMQDLDDWLADLNEDIWMKLVVGLQKSTKQTAGNRTDLVWDVLLLR